MRIVSALFALALGSMSAEPVRAEDSLAYGNEALRAWVERSAVETPDTGIGSCVPCARPRRKLS